MRKVIIAMTLMAAFGLMISCGGEKKSEEQEDVTEWNGMDAFHLVMADAFHPFKDSANIAPAIANAAALNDAAVQWSNNPLPKKVDNDEVRSLMEKLKQTTREFIQVAAGGDTTLIQETLTMIHDDFHHIQEAWYNADNEEDHGHEH